MLFAYPLIKANWYYGPVLLQVAYNKAKGVPFVHTYSCVNICTCFFLSRYVKPPYIRMSFDRLYSCFVVAVEYAGYLLSAEETTDSVYSV